MRAVALVALLCALAVSLVHADAVALTAKSFDSVIDGSKAALVEFYAPWCGHCKALEPTYNKLSDAFAHAKDNVVIAKIDADEHKSIGSRFKVQGFPTIKFFPKGSKTPEDYSGGRSLEELVSFIEGKASVKSNIKKAPSDVVVLTTTNFDKMVLDPAKNTLVEFYAPWCGHCKQLAPTWEKVASVFAADDHIVIAKLDATAEAALGEKYGVQAYPTIKFFPAVNKGETKKPVDYGEGRSEKDFIQFINEKTGTQRSAGGSLSDLAGTVESLREFAQDFLKSKEKRSEIMKQAQEAITKASDTAQSLLPNTSSYHPSKTAKHYIKTMEKIAEKGDAYVEKEIARLERLRNDDAVSRAKKDLFSVRINILKAFQAAVDKGEDLAEEIKEEL
ncbi:hypothetical protein RI367_006976 [Sorochytrium milnesiophthora]